MYAKLALAFVLGGAAIGGGVYLAMHRSTPAAEPPAATVESRPVADSAATPAADVESAKPGTDRAPARRSAWRPARAEDRKPQPAQPAGPANTEVARSEPAAAPAPHVNVPAPPQPREPEPVEAQPPARQAAPPRQAHTITIPAGTTLTVRLRDHLSTAGSTDGQNFQGTLDQPLIVDGFVIAERGSLQRGRIVALEQPGRVKGRASMSLQLTEMNTSDGQRVEIATETFRQEAASGVKGDAAKIGAGSAIGAAIGAIAGGGKGAGLGAIIGGGAGAGGVLATKGKHVELPSETRITFKLKEPVTITEKLN